MGHEDEEEDEAGVMVDVVAVEVGRITRKKQAHQTVKTRVKFSAITVNNMDIMQLSARIQEKKEALKAI